MAIFDATTLLLLIEPSARPPRDPSTGKPVERSKDRLDFLVERLNDSGTKVVIPTPVLSEILVGAGDARGEYLSLITSSSAFMTASFDVKASVELSFLLDAGGMRPKKKLSATETYAKLKFDRQVIAIAKANGIKEIYTDDTGMSDAAAANGLTVHHTWELPLPPQRDQQDWVANVSKGKGKNKDAE
jgi:predicted nucleic acid-binding protein